MTQNTYPKPTLSPPPGFADYELLLALNLDVRVVSTAYPGVGPRFVREFGNTWRRIPIDDRPPLVHFWHGQRPSVKIVRPSVELVDEIPHHCEPVRTRYIRGSCHVDGRQLSFLASVIAHDPPDAVRRTIAHELAHALLIAANIQVCLPYSRQVGLYNSRTMYTDEPEAERMAENIIAGWGFPRPTN